MSGERSAKRPLMSAHNSSYMMACLHIDLSASSMNSIT
nr:MAG TPA: hypothetical protein [Caudoviricetes sp.]